jgi:hypothetical protein
MFPPSCARKIALLGLLTATLACSWTQAEEAPIRLDRFVVSEGLVAFMVPYDQLLNIAAETREGSFHFSHYVLTKHADSSFSRPLKHLLRDASGAKLMEPEPVDGVFEINAEHKGSFASSNQPAEMSDLFLLFRADCLARGGKVSCAEVKGLLKDYQAYVERCIADSRKHYAASKNSFSEVYLLTNPDQVLILFRTQVAAEEASRRLGLKAQGRALRIPEKLLASEQADLMAQTLDTSVVEALSPWRANAELPTAINGCIPFIVGWVRYRSFAFQPYRCDLIMPGIVSPQ